MKNNKQLKNKYVLVTGTSGDIGFQIAKDFLSLGATVGAHYYGNKQQAEKLLQHGNSDQCQTFEADFSQSEEKVCISCFYL